MISSGRWERPVTLMRSGRLERRAAVQHPIRALAAAAVCLGASVAPLTSTALASQPAAAAGASAAAYDDASLIVSFAAGASGSKRAAALAGTGGVDGAGATLVRVPRGKVEAAVAHLRGDSAVRYAEPNFRLHVAGTPNDTQLGSQWAVSNTGQTGSAPVHW